MFLLIVSLNEGNFILTQLRDSRTHPNFLKWNNREMRGRRMQEAFERGDERGQLFSNQFCERLLLFSSRMSQLTSEAQVDDTVRWGVWLGRHIC